MDDATSAPSSAGVAVAAAAAEAAAASARVLAAAPSAPAGAVAPAAIAPEAGACRRQMFSVELRPGETTFVSWRKLLREDGVACTLPPPAVAAMAVAGAGEPVLAPHAGPSGEVHPSENDLKDPAQSNRFNAVIEKIERLYMGKHSSDEEDLDDVPDDDQYDTDDSFIDDTELDEYFEVDNLATKHNGYFVNKGKLEQIEPGALENAAPKKRRSKESSSSFIENNLEFALGNCSNVGNVPIETFERSASPVKKKLASSNSSSYGEYHHEDNRTVKDKISASARTQKRNSSDLATIVECAAHKKTSTKDVSLAPSEPKDFEKRKAAVLRPIDSAHKSRTSQMYDYPPPAYWDKDTSMLLDFQSKKNFNGESQHLSKKIRRNEKCGHFPGLRNVGTVYSTQAMHLATNRGIGGSGTKTKGTRLERAIRDLQKHVTESRPPTLAVREVDPNSQAAVKRRLPQDVKLKLAKVARLSANQGKISEDELIDHLMGILGHLVQRRTLKKNMKEMVESGLSAKQEKADRFQQVKMEIYEMIKARLATKAKDGSADDLQEVANNDERSALKGNSVMDDALEDRICDLYDLYVEGMDEDKGPQSRKLYVELAELWPQGYMDKVGVRNAIYRSKERRNLLYRQQKVRSVERMKRKRQAAAAKLQDGNPVLIQAALAQQVMQPSVANAQPSMTKTIPVVDYGQNQGLKSIDRVREMSIGAVSDDNGNTIDMKKRKLELDLVDIQANPLKATLQHCSEEQKPPKHADDAKSSSLPHRACTPVPDAPSYDHQPS